MSEDSLQSAKRNIRTIALALGVFGFWDLASSLLVNWAAFDPSYLLDYFSQVLARPITAIVISKILWWTAGSLARWMIR